MSNRKKITLITDNYCMDVEIISIFRIKDKEYVIYCVDNMDGLSDVYVGGISKDNNGNDIIVSMDSEIEKKNMNYLVDNVLKRSRVIKWEINVLLK